MIPCVSINPQRADAIVELERCAAKGAKVLKIHPPIQGVDISGEEIRPVLPPLCGVEGRGDGPHGPRAQRSDLQRRVG